MAIPIAIVEPAIET